MLAALDRRLGDLRQRRAVATGRGGDVADREHLGMAGDAEVGLDHQAPAAGRRRAERGGEALGRARPSPTRSCRRAIVVPSVRCTSSLSTASTPVPRRTSTPRRVSVRRARADDCSVNGVSRRSAISTSVMRAAAHGQLGEVLGQHLRVQLAQAAGHLDPGRPAAADDDVEDRRPSRSTGPRRPPRSGVRTWTRSASASSRCFSGSVCSATPGMPKSWLTAPLATTSASYGDDVAVERARPGGHGEVDGRHARHADADVGGPPAATTDAAPDGVGDVLAVQPRRRDLVQQRLERVEVVGVEQRDLDRLAEQGPRRGQATEAGADDDDVGPTRTRRRGCRTRCHTPTLGSPHGRRWRAPPGVRGVLRVHLRARRG